MMLQSQKKVDEFENKMHATENALNRGETSVLQRKSIRGIKKMVALIAITRPYKTKDRRDLSTFLLQ